LDLCRDAPNNRLLDIGSGDGDLWEFVPSSQEGYAVDISYVGSKRAASRFPHLKASVAIAEDLPYPDHFFGSAVAADTIEHVFDIQGSLTEVRRVLVPSGHFALSVPTPNSLQKWAFNRLLRQIPSPMMVVRLLWIVTRRTLLFGRAAFQPIDRDLSLNHWCAHLEEAGFAIERVIEWPLAPLKPLVHLISTRKV
jgi:ubiquinone/menaquinone biosynthesis C-methylase UbiE